MKKIKADNTTKEFRDKVISQLVNIINELRLMNVDVPKQKKPNKRRGGNKRQGETGGNPPAQQPTSDSVGISD